MDRWERLLTPVFDRYDRGRDRAQHWIDETAGKPIRAWVAPILLAFAATAAFVGLFRLLLAAAGGFGPAGRWTVAAIIGTVAVIVLVIVTRNVVVSLADPSQRRLLLIALITSGAGILSSVQAVVALTIALSDDPPSLWTIERFYLWRLVGSVPLLDIPARLEWTEPPVLPGVSGHVLELAFALVVIPPLVRVGIALYGHAEDRARERNYSEALAHRFQARSSWSSLADPRLTTIAAAAGVTWTLVELYRHTPTRILSLTTLAGVVTAAALAVAARAAVRRMYDHLSEQAVLITLACAGLLVWFDSPVRELLLPSAASLGLWAKLGVTLAAWLVLLLVVLVFVWSDPEFLEALLALTLVIGFLGADAPAAGWLREHVTWRPWELPLGQALATAGGWFTVAFLVHLVWAVARRQQILGRADHGDTASGLRQDLRAYALRAVHLVIAAGAALTLLRSAHAATVSRPTAGPWTEASQSLTAAVWHVVDSLPGPDVTDILDWRLTADVTGRWAGLVIILAVGATVLLVALPLIRTVALWARLTAGRPRSSDALASVPGAIADDLTAVVAFMEDVAANGRPEMTFVPRDRPRPFGSRVRLVIPTDAPARRLVQAELNMAALVRLFGHESAWYQAADRAFTATARAFGVNGLPAAPHPGAGRRQDTVAAARAAVDEYTALIAGWRAAWQAGAPVGEPAAAPAATE
ncbi:hypothetical protein GCM10009661_14030 [Catellatospora chokoriensis]|uniref:Uncharacterized protein n=1 Tax=Catellatospora chokoriensis TaxID=310353 RepID=A0A8J3NVQ6_9ACTN|nr:hypothetical protein Cch02nite_76420 [Catellatospora chokoriensis]